MNQFMQGPGAGLPKPPDIVLENFDGRNSFTCIDLKTFDATGPTCINTDHTDRSRLTAHNSKVRDCNRQEYKTHLDTWPTRMRLIVIPISINGSIGPTGQSFIRELSKRCGRGTVPFSLLPHTSWATPAVGPMIRMALVSAVRRGLASSVHTHWQCGHRAGAPAMASGGEAAGTAAGAATGAAAGGAGAAPADASAGAAAGVAGAGT